MLARMKGIGARLPGTIVTVVAAAIVGLAARSLVPSGFGWAVAGASVAAMVSIVAGSGYVSRRDPALLLLSAGAGSAFVALALRSGIDVYAYRRTGSDPLGDGVRAVEGFMPFVGSLLLAIWVVLMVPWRDRRGRSPLRATTVAIVAGAAVVTIVGVLLVVGPSLSETAVQILSAAIVVVALVAAIRSIVRGRWYGWIGGGGFALAIAYTGLIAGFPGVTDQLRTFAEYAWFTIMPTVGMFLFLIGMLAAQRAEASRMRRASDRATEVMEGRAEIASIVAHDVRGPAGTIRSVAGSLRTSYGRLGDAERLEFVGMIEQESLRLLRVADQMSLGLKTDAGTLPFTLVAREIEGPILQGLQDADVGERVVHVDLDRSVTAKVDDRWFAESVRQGLENAMKFSPADTPIDLRTRIDGDTAVVEIADAGPGIPEEMREAVFEKFSRWRPVGYEDRSGSGLGLFIVRSIVREHGGEAILADGPAGGTILQIRVPVEEPA
jgi:signal transduction histidine kinase